MEVREASIWMMSLDWMVDGIIFSILASMSEMK